MLKSFFENMACANFDEEQEERELYEVAANYDDFGIGASGVSAKKPADADINLVQVMELNREIQEIEPPSSLLDAY